jgi:hypothetical protein
VGYLLTLIVSNQSLQEVFSGTARNRSGKGAEQRGTFILVFRPASPAYVTVNVKNLKLSLCLIYISTTIEDAWGSEGISPSLLNTPLQRDE